MKKFIGFLLILALLGGAGFGVYWLFFRDKSDGGSLTNKEVVFVLQNVLEDQGIDLNSIVENHEKVDFAPASSLVVLADEQGLEERFNGILTQLQAFEYDNSNFGKFSNFVIEAYKALYNNVFNNKSFKQNVWYEIENGKIKVYADASENVNIYAFGADIYYEIKIDYNFRNENNVYSLEAKILSAGETQTYEYLYFNRDADKVLSFNDVKFSSTEKYLGDEQELNLTADLISANKFHPVQAQPFYLQFKELSDEEKTEIVNYVCKNLKVNFENFENIKNANAEKIN